MGNSSKLEESDAQPISGITPVEAAIHVLESIKVDCELELEKIRVQQRRDSEWNKKLESGLAGWESRLHMDRYLSCCALVGKYDPPRVEFLQLQISTLENAISQLAEENSQSAVDTLQAYLKSYFNEPIQNEEDAVYRSGIQSLIDEL